MTESSIALAPKSRLFRPLWHEERFFVLDHEPCLVEAAIPLTFDVHEVWSPALEAALERIRGEGGDLSHRFGRGHRCFVLRYDGDPVGCGWASVGEWGGDGPPRPLALNAGFVYDGFTRADCRGKRIAPARQAYVARRLRADGCARICTTIRDENVASQKAAMRAGYRRTDHMVRVYRMRCMGWLQRGGPPREFLPGSSSAAH